MKEYKEIKDVGDELLVILEKALVERIQFLLEKAGIKVSERDATVILAKIGKNAILKVLSG